MMEDKKTVLITGATGVIGSCIAEHFFDAGYRLILSGRSEDKLKELKEKFGDSVLVYSVDVSKSEEVKKMLDFIDSEVGRLDVVVSAAGIYGYIGKVEQCDVEKWEDAFRVNTFGSMYTAKYSVPLLKKSKSASIIFFAGGGEGPLPNFSSYASSKGAVLRLSESLSAELKEYGIKVNTIYPGLVNSGFTKNIISVGKEFAGEEMYQLALDQVRGKAESVSPDNAGKLCLFLSSEASDGITGKLFAARWDDLEKVVEHKDDIMSTDIYSPRRIKPKDRGYEW